MFGVVNACFELEGILHDVHDLVMQHPEFPIPFVITNINLCNSGKPNGGVTTVFLLWKH